MPSLKCMLGLVACLQFGGHEIPVEDVIAAMDTCELARTAPTRHFDALADNFEDHTGIRVKSTRRGDLLQHCARLKAAFDQPRRWSNLEKWPY